MKNRLKTTIGMGALLLALVSCSEDQIATYSGPEAINLWIGSRDSAEISFLSLAPEVTEYVFQVEVNIQTLKSEKAREVKFEMGDKTTGKADVNFEMPASVIIPAGGTSAVLPVKVFKKGLVDVDGGLVAEVVVVPSDDFIGGIYGKVKLSFSGDFPKLWYSSNGINTAVSFLGKCTKAKYNFVYDQIKTIDLADYSDWNYVKMQNLQKELNRELDLYAAENDGKRLPDDDGGDMKFSPGT